MSLSDDDVQKQIDHMMQFIEQEANEKVEEIDAKAEEEFNIEKGKIVQEQRLKIMEYFDKKEKQVELQRKIQSSNMLNQARLRVLKSREDHIRDVLEEAKKKLHEKTKNKSEYEDLMTNLILQAALQLLEPSITVKCRKDDLNIVKSCQNSVAKQYEEHAGKQCKIHIDEENFLGQDCAGGIEISAQSGKIRIDNSLETRLERVSQQLLPDIRETLFGPNPNRRFKD